MCHSHLEILYIFTSWRKSWGTAQCYCQQVSSIIHQLIKHHLKTAGFLSCHSPESCSGLLLSTSYKSASYFQPEFMPVFLSLGFSHGGAYSFYVFSRKLSFRKDNHVLRAFLCTMLNSSFLNRAEMEVCM